MRPRRPSLTNQTCIAATRGAVHSPGGRCGFVLGRLHCDLAKVVYAPAPAHRGPKFRERRQNGNRAAVVKVAQGRVAPLRSPGLAGIPGAMTLRRVRDFVAKGRSMKSMEAEYRYPVTHNYRAGAKGQAYSERVP